jgi:hypothetical protein
MIDALVGPADIALDLAGIGRRLVGGPQSFATPPRRHFEGSTKRLVHIPARAVRFWWNRFVTMFAVETRKRRVDHWLYYNWR